MPASKTVLDCMMESYLAVLQRQTDNSWTDKTAIQRQHYRQLPDESKRATMRAWSCLPFPEIRAHFRQQGRLP